jgi:hypothetical protein
LLQNCSKIVVSLLQISMFQIKFEQVCAFQIKCVNLSQFSTNLNISNRFKIQLKPQPT